MTNPTPAQRERHRQELANQLAMEAGLIQWEYGFEGLIFGGLRSVIGLTSVRGLDAPAARVASDLNLASHGGPVFARYFPPRIIQFQGTVVGTAAAKSATMAEMGTAFSPRDYDLPLMFILGDNVLKVVNCRYSRFEYDIDDSQVRPSIKWALEMIAGDPRIYANDVQVVILQPADVNVPGHGFDVGFDMGFGGGTNGGYANLVNAGNMETLPIIRLQGPLTSALLRNVSEDLDLSLTITLAPEDHLDLDFAARTIILNDDASRYSALDIGSVWWPIFPGTTQIQFVATGTTEQTSATVTFRSAWENA